MMGQDENVQFVSFTDSFMPGTEGKRIKLQPDNLDQFRNTIRDMFQTVAIANGNISGVSENRIESERTQVAQSSTMSTEDKERKMAALDTQEQILEVINVKDLSLDNVNRVFKSGSKLLSLTPEILENISKQAINEEKLEMAKEQTDNKEVPIQTEISPETVQAAIDEVQEAFDTVLAKAKETKPTEKSVPEKDWDEGSVAALFGDSSPRIELEPVKEEEKSTSSKEPAPTPAHDLVFAEKVEEKANKKLENEIPMVDLAPTEVEFDKNAFQPFDFFEFEKTPYEEPVGKHEESKKKSPINLELPSFMKKETPKKKETEDKNLHFSKIDDGSEYDFFGTLPKAIAEKLKVDNDIVKALTTLSEEQDRTKSLKLIHQETVSKRDIEAKKLEATKKEVEEAKQSKADATEEAARAAKLSVMEAIKARIRSTEDDNARIEERNQAVVAETVRLSEEVAQKAGEALQYKEEANNIRAKSETPDWLRSIVKDIIGPESSPKTEGRGR